MLFLFGPSKSHQFFQAFVWLMITTGLVGAGTVNHALGQTLADRLAGKNIPDFTIVYTCARHNNQEGVTREQITAQVRRLAQKNGQPMNQPLPNQYQQDIDMIMSSLEWDAKVKRVILTISKRGNKLLVKEEIPALHQLTIVVYDGKRTMSTVRGSNAMIDPGFQFVDLSDFVFPGCGICDIPLIREMSPMPGTTDAYTGKVATQNGWAAVGGLPDYRYGKIQVRKINGIDCVTELVQGWPFPLGYRLRNGKQVTEQEQLTLGTKIGTSRQVCSFSDYRNVGPGFSLPGHIRLTEYYRQGTILAYGEQFTEDYKLQSASAAEPPESDFQLDTHLTSVTIVQDNPKEGPFAIRYVPGKPLDQQFQETREARKQASLISKSQTSTNSLSGILGVFALFAGLGGWYLYRRSAGLRDKG